MALEAGSVELYDPGTGTWKVTGSMVHPREGHTATLLADGRVLVAGGANPITDGAGPVPTSAELYDPGTGTWTATGSLATGRYAHTATRLPDGKVLVAGGDGCGGHCALDSAELYDPGTGTWTATGNMLAPRNTITATLLRDGKVLVVGGIYPNRTASVELYDPGTGTWTATGSWVRSGTTPYVTATRLLDGRVLVTGTAGTLDSTAELYNPDTGAWTATGNTVGDRWLGATATLLPDGRVLLAGGRDFKPDGAEGQTEVALASAELYDAVTGAWAPTVSMATGRVGATGTLLPDGRVLVVGGGLSSGAVTSELYDPGSGN
jgi:Kelch motif protein/galactose oxidase-like protein